jgi:mono/diheme cytochrome c family protein
MTEPMRDDPVVVTSTQRWQAMGVFVFMLLVLSFPVYKAVEGHRRTDALSAQSAALITGGKQLWALNCTTCHGINGQGVDAPALNSQEFLTNATDQQIHGIIAGGVPGTEMSAWWNEYGGPLTDQQITELTAYIRSWQKTAPSVPNWRTPSQSSGS